MSCQHFNSLARDQKFEGFLRNRLSSPLPSSRLCMTHSVNREFLTVNCINVTVAFLCKKVSPCLCCRFNLSRRIIVLTFWEKKPKTNKNYLPLVTVTAGMPHFRLNLHLRQVSAVFCSV